jgi:hypothetical protein
VVFYHSNPYLHPAWDFPGEPWLSFMNNIEARTPYGYVWTGLSSLVYLAVLGDLQVGMLAFRLLSIGAYLAIGWSIGSITKKEWKAASWFLFNPLVLLEVVMNMHNDIVMMAFFMVGLAWFYRFRKHRLVMAGVILIIGWILSVYTKTVTVIIPGVYLIHRGLRRWLSIDWFGLLALAFIGIMFVDGSRRFYPWYLLWAISVAGVSTNIRVKQLMVSFSITGSLAYILYLVNGGYSAVMLTQRFWLLFSLPILYTGWWIATGVVDFVKRKQRKS